MLELVVYLVVMFFFAMSRFLPEDKGVVSWLILIFWPLTWPVLVGVYWWRKYYGS